MLWSLPLLLLLLVGGSVVTATASHGPPVVVSRGVVYTPHHNWEFPAYGGWVPTSKLRPAIEEDLRLVSKYFTHIRTRTTTYFGLELVPLAARLGLKVYLGIEWPLWGHPSAADIDAAARAIRAYPETVEAVIVGNRVLEREKQRMFGSHHEPAQVMETLATIRLVIDDIKTKAGIRGRPSPVRFGTIDSFDWVDCWRAGDCFWDQTGRLDREGLEVRYQQLMGNLSTLDLVGAVVMPRATPVFAEDWDVTAAWLPPTDAFFVETDLEFYYGGCRMHDCWPSESIHDEFAAWRPRQRGPPLVTFWMAAFDSGLDQLTAEPVYSPQRGYFTFDRRRKLPGIPRPLSPSDDPIRAIAPMFKDVDCRMGMYHRVLMGPELVDSVRLCIPSGFNFRNPTTGFDERSIQGACKNLFCHLVIRALRKIPSDPACPFHPRMTREMLDRLILTPFDEYCDRNLRDKQIDVVSLDDVNVMSCWLYGEEPMYAAKWQDEPIERCEDVSKFSLLGLEKDSSPMEPYKLTPSVLESMCFKPSCEALLAQMAMAPDAACDRPSRTKREWIIENIVKAYFDGCYTSRSALASAYYEAINREPKEHPVLPWLEQEPKGDDPLWPMPVVTNVSSLRDPSNSSNPDADQGSSDLELGEDSSDTELKTSRAVIPPPRPGVRRSGTAAATSDDGDDDDVVLDASTSRSSVPRPRVTVDQSHRKRRHPDLGAAGVSTDGGDEDLDESTRGHRPTLHSRTWIRRHWAWVCGTLLVVLALALGVVFARRPRREPGTEGASEHYAAVLDDPLGEEDPAATRPPESRPPLLFMDDPVIQSLFIPPQELRDLRLIGSGGQALVYLVRQTPSASSSPLAPAAGRASPGPRPRHRFLAAKRIPRRKATHDTDAVVDFLTEIRTVAGLRHPNIVRLVGASWTTSFDIQALFEFIPGGDLATHLSSTPRYEWDATKVQLAVDVASALTYVHALDPPLVHRDIKSRNVLLVSTTKSPRPLLRAKLTDFGVARRHSAQATMTTGVGTSRWLAPEVILGGGDYDQSCDIYSFGVLLSELDTHELPFVDRQTPSGDLLPDNALLQLIATNRARPKLTVTCPREIRELAEACLAYDRRQRPTATEVRGRLRALLRTTSATDIASTSPSKSPKARRPE